MVFSAEPYPPFDESAQDRVGSGEFPTVTQTYIELCTEIGLEKPTAIDVTDPMFELKLCCRMLIIK